jgi:hypothetical protein
MTLSWQQLSSAADIAEAWRQAGAASRHATFFHTQEWSDLFCASMTAWQPDPIAVEFTDGNLAVLPMLRRVGSEHRQAMAPFVYGGPLFLRPPTEAHWDEFGKIPRWYSDIVLYDNPFSPYAWDQEGLIRWRIHTHVLDLSPGFDRVLAGCRRMIRQNCRSAERAGIAVSPAQSLAQVDEYYDAYLDSLSRWSENVTSLYPRGLFHDFFRLQTADRGVRLWVAEVDGLVVSGVVVLYHAEHSVAWHAATHSDYLSSHASPLVHLAAIRAGCSEGLRWYDFNPSGQLRSLEFFKESFGTERRRFNMYHSPVFTQPADLHSSEGAEDERASATG